MATTVTTPDPAMQGPALLRLRPRDVPGLFDQAVWLYRRNFRAFLGIAALIYLPVTVLISLADLAARPDRPDQHARPTRRRPGHPAGDRHRAERFLQPDQP